MLESRCRSQGWLLWRLGAGALGGHPVLGSRGVHLLDGARLVRQVSAMVWSGELGRVLAALECAGPWSVPRSGRLPGDPLLGPVQQGRWRDRADLPGDLSALAQDQQGRDAPHAQALGDPRGLVDVDLHRLEAAGQLTCRPLDPGGDHPARSDGRCAGPWSGLSTTRY